MHNLAHAPGGGRRSLERASSAPAPLRPWGQNFLRAPATAARIVAALGPPAGSVVELGAGTGALTRLLVEAGWQVVAVERDRRLAAWLREGGLDGPRCRVVEADAARAVPAALLPDGWPPEPLQVVGNLPYHLASRILVHLAGLSPAPGQLVVMVQKEVGQRLAAAAGERACGLLSYLVQRTYRVQRLFDVAPGAFHPPPKVTSQVLRLCAHGQGPPAGSGLDQERVAAARLAFCAPRRTLTRILIDHAALARPAALAVLEAAQVAPLARPQALSVAAVGRLAAALAVARGGGGP